MTTRLKLLSFSIAIVCIAWNKQHLIWIHSIKKNTFFLIFTIHTIFLMIFIFNSSFDSDSYSLENT